MTVVTTRTEMCGKPATRIIKGGEVKYTPLCYGHAHTQQIRHLVDIGAVNREEIPQEAGAVCAAKVERELEERLR